MGEKEVKVDKPKTSDKDVDDILNYLLPRPPTEQIKQIEEQIIQEKTPETLSDQEIDELSATISEQSKEELVDALKRLNITDVKVELDKKGKIIMKQIVDKCKQMNIDWFIAIVGGEGVGKSTMTLNLFAETCKIMGYNTVQTLLRTLIYDEDELLKLISNIDPSEKFLPINLDEGANVLFNRESMKAKRAYILKFFNVMRFLNAIVFINTPNIKFIDKNVREHRLKSVFFIPQRGVYWFYDKKQLDRMNAIETRKRWYWIEPRKVGTFGVNKELETITVLVKENYIRMFSEKVAKFLEKQEKSRGSASRL